MFTDCPTCRRQFRLAAHHLSAAAGQVRCGFCGTQFSALTRLRDVPLDPVAMSPGAPEPELEEPDFDIAPPDDSAVPARKGRDVAARRVPGRFAAPEMDAADAAEAEGGLRGWAVIAVVLLLAGAAQLGWFQRETLLSRFPALLPHAELLCARLGCDVLRHRDLTAISVLNRDVRLHPRYEDSLLVNATIRNDAGFPQPFPRIQLALSDTNGRVIAARAFAPAEYLDHSMDLKRGMKPGAPVHVVLEIVGVGTDAVSFEIGFM